MTKVYDLHAHTTASDGKLSPVELVTKARDCGIDVLAITDHDTTSGINSALEEAKKQNIKVLPGIELSVSWMNKDFHIVGLNIDPDNHELQNSLEETANYRDQRAIKIGEQLDKVGVTDAYSNAKALAKDQTLTRSHFARVLIEQGFAKDSKEVFKKFLVQNKPGFVKSKWIELEQGLQLINNAGGVAILAHPLRYNITASWLRRFLEAFKSHGGIGIEVVTGSSSADEIKTAISYANRFDLLGSSGSDYHGYDDSWIKFGNLAAMPNSVTPVWNHWDI